MILILIGMHNLEHTVTDITHCRMGRDTRLMMLGGGVFDGLYRAGQARMRRLLVP